MTVQTLSISTKCPENVQLLSRTGSFSLKPPILMRALGEPFSADYIVANKSVMIKLFFTYILLLC